MKKPLDSFSNRRNHEVILDCATLSSAIAELGASAIHPDGVTLINQSTVLSAGGFPYRVTQPGSYRLSGDLIANTTAISIYANDVTLDLNSFQVLCNCSAVPGIASYGSGTAILNGYILGCRGALTSVGPDGCGIYFAGPRARVNRVRVSESLDGIYAEEGVDLSVTASTVSNNGGDGIVCRDGALTVGNSIIAGNGNRGIVTSRSALITGNTIDGNAQTGIDVGAGSVVAVSDNIIANHLYTGVFARGGTTAIDSNTFVSNGTHWFAAGAVSIKNNVCEG